MSRNGGLPSVFLECLFFAAQSVTAVTAVAVHMAKLCTGRSRLVGPGAHLDARKRRAEREESSGTSSGQGGLSSV